MTIKMFDWQIDLLYSLWMLTLSIRDGTEILVRPERNCRAKQNLYFELMTDKLWQAKG